MDSHQESENCQGDADTGCSQASNEDRGKMSGEQAPQPSMMYMAEFESHKSGDADQLIPAIEALSLVGSGQSRGNPGCSFDSIPGFTLPIEAGSSGGSRQARLRSAIDRKRSPCIPLVSVFELQNGANIWVGNSTPNLMRGAFDISEMPCFIVPPRHLCELLYQPTNSGCRGIKGYLNSCYMDSMLFSMFSFTTTFDNLLLEVEPRPGEKSYEAVIVREARILLSSHIVNALRQDGFCGFEAIYQFREILSPLDPKFHSSCMDVEEVMYYIFNLWNLDPFITYDGPVTDFLHQINVHGIHSRRFTTVQNLFEASLVQQNLRMISMPFPALILEYPRVDGNLVNHMVGVIPTLTLNLNHCFSNGVRPCFHCDQRAELECRDCFDIVPRVGMKSTSYCPQCYFDIHNVDKRHHKTIQLVPFELQTEENFLMEIVAVICYRDSHFVSFVKGSGESAPWMFHDSNPPGENTINKILPDMSDWIRELETLGSTEIHQKWNFMDGMLKRLMSDGHICIYRPTQHFGLD